jgi:hypothetical protein
MLRPSSIHAQGFFVMSIFDEATKQATNACEMMLYAKASTSHVCGCGRVHQWLRVSSENEQTG